MPLSSMLKPLEAPPSYLSRLFLASVPATTICSLFSQLFATEIIWIFFLFLSLAFVVFLFISHTAEQTNKQNPFLFLPFTRSLQCFSPLLFTSSILKTKRKCNIISSRCLFFVPHGLLVTVTFLLVALRKSQCLTPSCT